MPTYHRNYFDGLGLYADALEFQRKWSLCDDCKHDEREQYIDELSKQFEQLKDQMKEDGYITVGFFCKTMNLECDNPYDIYSGDKDAWQKALITTLNTKKDDPKESKLLIEALHNQYDEEEE